MTRMIKMSRSAERQQDTPDFRIKESEKHKYDKILNKDSNMNGLCPKSSDDSCPAGHSMKMCADNNSYRCEMCPDGTFQPNEVWIGDNCRMKKTCGRNKNLVINNAGSNIRDAECRCLEGHYFISSDQRACFPNPECDVGFEPGKFGGCESCFKKGMYSNIKGRNKKCIPMTNCIKQGRCVKTASNGIHNNVCGPVVKDLSTCEELEASYSTADLAKIAVPCGILGILIVIGLVLFLWRRPKYRKKYGREKLSPEETEELKQKIVKASASDHDVCKKVIDTLCSFVEERIGRQYWDLARELFRAHPVSGKYEQVVEKYKDNQPKYTVNNYIREWKEWRGENKDAVSEFFRCLILVKRDDIVSEVCACLKPDIDDDAHQTTYAAKKDSFKDKCMFIYCPCFYKEKELSPHKAKSNPTSASAVVVEVDPAETKLLGYPTDDVDDSGEGGCGDVGKLTTPGVAFRSHPSPSAPELDDLPSHLPSHFPKMDDAKFNRQLSMPVQCTS